MESKYQQALKKLEQAENECIAELFNECCEGNPWCLDENGNWMTKEEVYQALLRGVKK